MYTNGDRQKSIFYRTPLTRGNLNIIKTIEKLLQDDSGWISALMTFQAKLKPIIDHGDP